MSYATDGVDWDAPPGWRPGSVTAYVKAAVCPTCGCLEVHHKGGNGNSDEKTTRWYCPRCESRWKLNEKKSGRANIVVG